MKPPYLPMLAKDPPAKDSPLPGAGWVIEKKRDGWRWIVWVRDGVVYQWSGRNGLERSLRPLADALSWLPDDTVLDGELCVGEGLSGVSGSSAVSSALSRGLPLCFVVFDVLRLAGAELIQLPWEGRRAFLDKIGDGFDDPTLVHLSEVHACEAIHKELLHQEWLEAGFEGSIAKRIDARYRPGMRDAAFTKYKPQDSDEAVVVGFVAGKGSLTGQVGAFEIRMLKTNALTSVGIGDDERKDLRLNGPDAYLGKVIEIRHHGIRADSGKPRHPIFGLRRDDR